MRMKKQVFDAQGRELFNQKAADSFQPPNGITGEQCRRAFVEWLVRPGGVEVEALPQVWQCPVTGAEQFAMAVHTAMAAQIRYIIGGLPVGGTKALRHIAAHAFQADFPLINWPQDRADWAKVEEEAYEMFAAMVAEKIVEAVG